MSLNLESNIGRNIDIKEIIERANFMLSSEVIFISEFMETLEEIKEMAKGIFRKIGKEISEQYPNWSPGDFQCLCEEFKRLMFKED